jgi:hypothetical protein
MGRRISKCALMNQPSPRSYTKFPPISLKSQSDLGLTIVSYAKVALHPHCQSTVLWETGRVY